MGAMSTLRSAGLAVVVALAACRSTPYDEVQVDMQAPAAAAPPGRVGPSASALRFSVATMQSPRDTYAAYSRFFDRMGRMLGVEIRFVQRRTYAEVNDLLVSGQLDAALVCTGGYLDLQRRAPGTVEVLAVPVIDGRTTYRSLLIVPASSAATGLADLAGKRFAFTDELSFSGYVYATGLVRELGRDPSTFFGATLFTRSHDRSIEAVATGVVDGAAVDSLVYEALAARKDDPTARTRVIHRSPPYGVMPVVAAIRLPADTRARLQAVLLELHADPEAAAALRVARIERFVLPEPGLYDSAAAVARAAR